MDLGVGSSLRARATCVKLDTTVQRVFITTGRRVPGFKYNLHIKGSGYFDERLKLKINVIAFESGNITLGDAYKVSQLRLRHPLRPT